MLRRYTAEEAAYEGAQQKMEQLVICYSTCDAKDCVWNDVDETRQQR